MPAEWGKCGVRSGLEERSEEASEDRLARRERRVGVEGEAGIVELSTTLSRGVDIEAE